ncbi:ABC transporter ATP-binding protein [Prochlorococcus sp. MIT 1341]|uniref:ABC transporter ATP-binding protein n=1 Tax=Prochlorococcus sp. MIT 1341 TaxID=3096221 RepID=UPI002A747E37|nr:ABC transporter ATP-binding protein [Prochlorococcus sp. MIT 1341]
MLDTCLKIKGLWHLYGKSSTSDWSLKDIDFTLERGELVGLLGPSGCGKTTLLRLIAGFEKPSKGQIYINGREVASTKRLVPAEQRGIGMVFQDYALFPHLDAWQNVCFGLRRGQDKTRVNYLLELLGLADLRSRYPHELSGGQRQRLALARALAPGSSIVLLDEPFSNLDVEVRLRLRSELSGVLKSCGASGVLVTHDPEEALAICDRVAVLREGELHQCSEPSAIVQEPATPFVGRFVLQRNVLPLQNCGEFWSTPIGSIELPDQDKSFYANELMIDEQALCIQADPLGEGTIKGREFLGNYWLLKIQVGNHLLRVRQPLDNVFDIGDTCSVEFLSGGAGILFPGSIPCTL